MIHNSQKVEITIMSISAKWMNKMWDNHTMQHYSDMKRSEALTLTTTRINLENVMLNERSQTQKTTQCVIPLM